MVTKMAKIAKLNYGHVGEEEEIGGVRTVLWPTLYELRSPLLINQVGTLLLYSSAKVKEKIILSGGKRVH